MQVTQAICISFNYSKAAFKPVFLFGLATATALQFFLRYSVATYKCTNASELISWHKVQQKSVGYKNYGLFQAIDYAPING